jgi:2-polyprenyl-3-methyl-5-hydroxy-6-metoxy-1,4-benzoquinol methylase
MSNTERVDKELFRDEHYLGKPADSDDKIIQRRIDILYGQPGFFDKRIDCLEIGCGSGATINRVAREFKTCLGIDIFDYSAEFMRQQAHWQATNSRFRVVNLEKEMITERFERIISFEVIEHFQDENTVGKYFELLKPGGMAAISVPNKWWIFETHGARLPLLPWNRVPFFSWLPRPLHERWANARIYTKRRITKLLQSHGFEIEKVEYVTAPMDVLKEGKLKRFLTGSIFKNDTTSVPFLSTAIFVLAKKPLK